MVLKVRDVEKGRIPIHSHTENVNGIPCQCVWIIDKRRRGKRLKQVRKL